MIDVEVGLITKLIESKEFGLVKDHQIKPMYFTGDNESVFLFIQEFYMENGEVPTERVMKDHFPHFRFMKKSDSEIGAEEGIHYWCNELRKKVKHRFACEALQDSSEMLNALDTEEALMTLRKKISFIDNEVSVTTMVDVTKNTEDRIEAYKRKEIHKGIEGIETGFRSLDLAIGGLCNETLTTIIGKTGSGKEQPISSLVLTPNGFVTIGSLSVGDTVYNEDGEPCFVTNIYPQGIKEVFEITFDDGSKARCGREHLWKFKTQKDRSTGKDWRIDTLDSILMLPLKQGKGRNLVIPVCKPVEFAKKNLPIPPYSLGALLGDGGFTTESVSFSNTESDIVDRCAKELEEFVDFVQNGKCGYRYLLRKKNKSDRFNTLIQKLKSLNLWGVHGLQKHIPKEYLMSSEQDRRDLLAGLLDTDGSVQGGKIKFNTSSPYLADDLIFLCNSLGYRATKNSRDRDDSTHKNTEYTVNIRTDQELTYSAKHHTKYTKGDVKHHYYDLMKIVRIDSVGQEESVCIAVDTPTHTYLTDNFIVTHNTWLQILIGAYCQLQGLRVIQYVTEMSTDIMRDRYEAVLYSLMYGNFNYNDFKRGSLDPKTKGQFFSFLREDLPNIEPLFLKTASGVINMRTEIEDLKPDIVFIDGVYMMDDDQGARDDWLRLAHITRDLKKAAKHLKIPICINTQLDINSKGGLAGVRYSKAINEDSDTVIEIVREEAMITDNEAKLIVRKNREGTPASVIVNWNFRPMDFSEIYCESGVPNEDSDNTKVSSPSEPMIGI